MSKLYAVRNAQILFICTATGFQNYQHNRLKTPISTDDYIYASDACLTIRVNKSSVDDDFCYLCDDDKLINNVTSMFDNNLSYDLWLYKKDLKEALESRKLPTIRNNTNSICCDLCEGTGKVTWTFNHYKKIDKCPYCNGSGILTYKNSDATFKETFVEPHIRIYNRNYYAFEVQKILDIMEILNVEHLNFNFRSFDSDVMQFKINDFVEGSMFAAHDDEKYISI